jgi:hypothetical protein
VVRNDGNGAERAVLELRRGTVVVARREFDLARGRGARVNASTFATTVRTRSY